MKYFFLLLLFSFLCLGDLSAQVGINNENPSQTLDVGGKIKVGDDQIAPVAGTIRYNRVSKTFEGYDGTEWSVFNPDSDDGGGIIPASGTQVLAYWNANGSATSRDLTWRMPNSDDTFIDVPAGRTLYVTSIIILSRTTNTEFLVEPYRPNGSRRLHHHLSLSDGPGNRTQQYHDDAGQLVIIEPSGKLKVTNVNGLANVHIRGFLQ